MPRRPEGSVNRNIIPSWAMLRSIGNSRAVQASALFPAVGYLVLLSSQTTSFFDGGLVITGDHHAPTLWETLWGAKLYFVYFGLLSLGVGSAIYQWRCPRQVKKHGDWEDYVRIDGPAMHEEQLENLKQILRMIYRIPNSSVTPALYSLDRARSLVLNHYYAALSSDHSYARLAVAVLFAVGILLLAVPSVMTVLKILKSLMS